MHWPDFQPFPCSCDSPLLCALIPSAIMKLKYLAWLLVVALAIAAGLLYNSNQQQAAELAQLRSASQELEQLRTSQAGTNQSQTQAASDELTRLREENKDILRLRNEIRQKIGQAPERTPHTQAAQV